MTQTSQPLNLFPLSSTNNHSIDTSNPLDLFQNKQKKLDLGPVWSEDELQIFLKYFQQSGLKEIENIQEELTKAGYKRSVNNLLAVYMKNRNFLNYNPACKAKDLSAIMADHYENIEDSIPDINLPPLRKLKSAQSDENQDQQWPSSRETNSSHKIKFKMDDPLTLKKKSTSLKRSGYPVDEAVYNHNYKPKKLHTAASIFPKEKPKKLRKTNTTKGKFPLNFNFEDPELVKNLEIASRSCGGKSQKKSYFFLAATNSQNSKEFPTTFFKFLDCELIYSSLDSPYFEFNDLKHLLLGYDQNKKLTRKEWSFIRNCIGKPRRFSNNFLNEEKDKLQHYRRLVRNYLYENIPISENELSPAIIKKVKLLRPLQVSQIVYAIHPNCCHVHPGSILTLTGNSAILRFYPNELGATSVPDSKILTLAQDEGLQIIKNFDRTSSSLTSIPMNRMSSAPDELSNSLEKKVVDDIDFSAFSFIIKMLEKKTALVSELRSMNNLAETNPENLTDKLRQEYGWTGVHIKLLDNALKHAMTKYRLRGSNNYDIEQITNNLENLLHNPLRDVIESGKRNEASESETKMIKDIKNLLNKSIEEKIKTQLKSLTDKFNEIDLGTSQNSKEKSMEELEEKCEKEFEDKNKGIDASTCGRSEDKDQNDHIEIEKTKEEIEEKSVLRNKIVDDVDQNKKDKLKSMVQNMMGVLFTLKYQGDLNMTENKYLTELHTAVYEENPDEFHEINTVLLNICSK